MPLPQGEAGQEHGPGAHRAKNGGTRPAQRVGSDEAVDDAQEAATGKKQAGHVDAGVDAVAFLESRHGQGQDDETNRHVEPEDPVPGDAVDHRSADNRTQSHPQTADARPDAQGDAAPPGGKCL
jgi:hypothetical protein